MQPDRPGLKRHLVTRADQADWQLWAADRAQRAFQEGRQAGERGETGVSRRWLERARRLSQGAVQVDVALAVGRLADGDALGAINLLRDLLRRFDFRAGWSTLAAAHLARGSSEEAAEALQRALSHHAPDPSHFELIGKITRHAAWPGWCGLAGDGTLLINGIDAFAKQPGRSSSQFQITLDGRTLQDGLPRNWRLGRQIEIRRGTAPLLGSPLQIRSILRCEGFVEWRDGAVSGWLWHPGEPERAPYLGIFTTSDARSKPRRRMVLRDFSDDIDSETPLARLRRLHLSSEWLASSLLANETLHFMAEDGRALIGSPLDLRLLRSKRGRMKPVPALTVGHAPATRTQTPQFDVVIPVYRHLRRTLDCIASVVETVPADTRIVVVEDASPEPALCAALDELAQGQRVLLLRNTENRGFPRSANRGIEACVGRDVILLNSDTLVAPGWAEALRTAVYADPQTGTATPFSNDASILSYPDHSTPNPVPDRAETRRLMALAANANKDAAPVEIPTGVGFCWYLRRDCLDQTGLLREDLFAQGYGEENDFCLRARHLGWRHVAVPSCYVAHVGNVSFGAARHALMRRNLEIIARLHPGYDALIQTHIDADPLAEARRRLDRLRFIAGRSNPARAALLITHDEKGGVERVVQERARILAAAGRRVIILRPDGDSCQIDVAGTNASENRQYPNLRFRIDREFDLLAELLAGESIEHAEWHHLLGHHPVIRGLCAKLRIPYDIYVHDYASFCARIALVGPAKFYCGEPDVAGCEACIAEQGSNLSEPIGPRALVARSKLELAAARSVVAPSEDTSRRVARHFPGICPQLTPWQDDAPGSTLQAFAEKSPAPFAILPKNPARRRLCVIGGIGIEKGYEILRACLANCRERALPLDFVVVGHTRDDDALLDAGCLEITGAYQEDEAVGLIRAMQCDFAFLPSIWPETWSYTLTHAWRAGLAAIVFDIGAQAERVRRTRRGATIPLGMPIDQLNDTLLQVRSVPPPDRNAISINEVGRTRMAQ